MRKFLFILFLLFSLIGAMTAQTTVSYTTSTANILNPERGFYRSTSAGWNGTFNVLTTSQLNSYKSNGNSIILREYYLDQFFNSNISAAYLTKMQTDFNVLRSSGMKCIIRFAYSKDDSAGILYNPNKAQILLHNSQVTPVLQANEDVIMCLQLSYIGAWAEGDTSVSSATSEFCNTVGNYNSWYSPPYTTNNCWANRKQVYEAFMDILPNKYYCIRMPASKMAMYGTTAINTFGTDYRHRLGGFNDCFVSSPDDYWTYIPVAPAPQYPYLAQETLYAPMGGETCNLNPPRSSYSTAESEMRLFHWSYLNFDYNTSVLNSWSTNIEEVKKNLGYRIQLTSLTYPASVTTGQNFNLTLNLNNVGYAAPFNKRNATIVFKNTVSGVEFRKVLSTDTRTWLGVKSISESIVNDLPVGDYHLYLSLPDYNTSLQNRPDYAIQCANVGLWNAVTGYNDLQANITIAAPPSCITPTVWNGSVWSLGAPDNNTNAQISANYSGNSFKCCNLLIDAGATLDVQSGRYVSVVNDITNNGTLLIQDSASIVQVNDSGLVYNNGTTKVYRNTNPLGYGQYEYFSSPVDDCTIGYTFNSWVNNRTFTFFTPNFIDIETSYNGTFINNMPDNQDDDGDAWVHSAQSDIMSAGSGIAAMKTTQQLPPASYTVEFSGKLNNGVYNIPIYLSGNPSNTNDDWNLIGNPYASSIFSDNFINSNPSFSGTIMFWNPILSLSAANTGLSQLNHRVADYSYLNITGGTKSLSNSSKPTKFISGEQGFMVKALSNSSVSFSNSLRNEAYDNSDFHRESSVDRFWLNLEGDGYFSQTLIGYLPDTSLGYDRGYDSEVFGKPVINLYTDNLYKIQSRGVFNNSDIVPLSFDSDISGEFTLSIEQPEGVFELIPIYLKDKFLNTINLLPYTFDTTFGIWNNRFEIIYSTNLTTKNFVKEALHLFPNPGNNFVSITGGRVEKVIITNTLGECLGIKRNESRFSVSNLSDGMYYFKVFTNNKISTLKFIKNDR